MSINFNLYCKRHKVALDIGTNHGIYYFEPAVMNALNDFMFCHEGCEFKFLSDEELPQKCDKILPMKDKDFDNEDAYKLFINDELIEEEDLEIAFKANH